MRISFALGCGLFLAASSSCGAVRLSSQIPLTQRFADRCLYAPQQLPRALWNEGLDQKPNAELLHTVRLERQPLARVALAQGMLLPQGAAPEAWRDLAADLKRRVPYIELEVTTSRNQMDCLGDQIGDLRTEILRLRASYTLTWSLISVLVSGVGALVGGIVEIKADNDLPVPLIAIATGVTASGMAILALNEPATKVRLEHKRNALRAIWQGHNESQIFPTFVWHMLQLPASGAALSPRDFLLQEWGIVLSDHAKTPEERLAWEALLFGDGGTYEFEQLDVRERLYDQLQQEIQALHQAVYLVNELAP